MSFFLKSQMTVFAICVLTLSSCSAYLAAQKEGMDLEDVKRCSNRGELLSMKDVEIIETKQNELGEKEDTYKILKEKGSYWRAAFNLVESVFSFGLWETYAYPAEQTLREERNYYYLRVYYDKEDNIKKSELLGE